MTCSTRREHWRDLLAAEYVIGTLRGSARRRMQRWIDEDRATRDAVLAWERRMYLLAQVQPSQPSADLWQRIEAGLPAPVKTASSAPQTRTNARRRRAGSALGWLAAAAAVAFVAAGLTWKLLPQATPAVAPKPQVLVAKTRQFSALLGPHDSSAYWWVRFDMDKHKMLVVTLKEPIVPSNRTPQLWLIPRGGKPVSMGMLPRYASMAKPMPSMPKGAGMPGAKLAVSLEPLGGSPSGSPTGPVVFVAFVNKV